MLLIGTVHAAGGLLFSDVDVKVGGKTDNNMQNGETISQEAAPEDKVEFKVKVKSNFTLSADPDIEDIVITVTIDGIDGEDGEELEEESAEFNLGPNKDKSKTVSFQIPLEVEDGDYDATIEAEGEDEKGITHRATMKLTLEVEKEKHQIKIYRNSLSPSEVSCNRKGISHTVGLINIGEEDEENVIVSVTNSNLGLNFQDTISELSSEVFDDESKYLRTLNFDVPAELEAGNYPLNIKVAYGSKSETASGNFVVNECLKPATAAPIVKEPVTPKQEEQEEPEFVEVITPNVVTPLVIAPTTPVQTQEPEVTVEAGGIMSNKVVVSSIIAVEAIAVIAGIALVIHLARKR